MILKEKLNLNKCKHCGDVVEGDNGECSECYTEVHQNIILDTVRLNMPMCGHGLGLDDCDYEYSVRDFHLKPYKTLNFN